MDAISFQACIPQTQGAIKRDGQGGARITLEVAESDIMEVFKLSMLIGMVFTVNITPPVSDKGGGA